MRLILQTNILLVNRNNINEHFNMIGSDYIEFDRALNTGFRILKSEKQKSFGLLIICGINLGLRIQDLLNLTFEDLRKEKIHIIEGKTKKRRTLIVNDNIKKALNSFDDLDRGYCFKSQKQTVFSKQQVNRLMKKYFKGKVSSHSLRKTFGRRVWENDRESERSLIYLSEIFNHSSIQMTRIYLGIRQEELNEVYLSL
ncbi:MAG: tyrosine-type recombinase/integrase [Psychroserpens sp.]|uniref:tyrosine-type recombinase/integrase n=1 Tax=Psychroserpens sp. TaxID=2020870 RepID=UPI001B2F57CD|nr:tyrosine-type recombinase/integrase [Psychroserpens sp.]MBO6606721.1 tyrosine-type recombinase/integrase [Psychroserpens sp.]MBO6630768.1 tyrosine-type recombinase/integrase [Psychroserpens sp.]MBO6653425.1 tyrosine-type recombinase/integrase [Psychroserpens sp.]MBO6680548.1 tyrosine-type recombinase/integrase [Psychroserpens sp.]MBO6750494.1 tyrosine-type recombinase/integrase [Psychroserpens sp.]